MTPAEIQTKLIRMETKLEHLEHENKVLKDDIRLIRHEQKEQNEKMLEKINQVLDIVSHAKGGLKTLITLGSIILGAVAVFSFAFDYFKMKP